MKLIVQIPCFNEEGTLMETLSDIPEQIQGVSSIEILVVDDKSEDATLEVARAGKAHHILALPSHRGLAHTFRTGLQEALRLKADIVVNTDGDHQYKGAYISDLVRPIVEGRADIVIGCRPIEAIAHFSLFKKILQRLGSFLVRKISGTKVEDTTSGFRAFQRDVLLKMNIHSDFSYTLESIIEAGQKGFRIVSVPIQINPPKRPSRLFTSIPSYLFQSGITILRVYTLYRPLRVFLLLSSLSFLLATSLLLRFVFYYFWMFPLPSGKVQSLILASILFMFSFFCGLFALLSDLIAANRRLLEELLFREREK